MILTITNTKKILLFATMLALSVFVQFFVFSPKSEAQSTNRCYINLGNFNVDPETIPCPSRSAVESSQGRIVYTDESGNLLSNAPIANECYVRNTSGSGSFTSATYNRANCSDLEVLRLATFEQQCDNAGGEFNSSTESCVCPGDNVFSDAGCRAVGQSGGATEREDYPVDCTDVNVVDAGNCGIVRYIVLFINLLSALVGVVVVISIIVGGIQYSTAGSDPQKVSASKTRIRNAIFALFVYIFTYAFLNWLVPGGLL